MQRLQPQFSPAGAAALTRDNHRCLPLPNQFLSPWASDAAGMRIFCHKRSSPVQVHSSQQFIDGSAGQAPVNSRGNGATARETPRVRGWADIIEGLVAIRPAEREYRDAPVPELAATFSSVALPRPAMKPEAPGSAGYWTRRLKLMAERFSSESIQVHARPVATVFCQNFVAIEFASPLLISSNCPVAAIGKIPGRFIFATAISPTRALLSLPRAADLDAFAAMPHEQQAAFINLLSLAAASVAFDSSMDKLDFIGQHLGWALEANAQDIGREIAARLSPLADIPAAEAASSTAAAPLPGSSPTRIPIASSPVRTAQPVRSATPQKRALT